MGVGMFVLGWFFGSLSSKLSAPYHWKQLPTGNYTMIKEFNGMLVVQNADLDKGKEKKQFFFIAALAAGKESECLPNFRVEGFIRKRLVDLY